MLSDERIDEIILKTTGGFIGGMHFVHLSRAIEREATAPLIEQIKEDEALMRQAERLLIAVHSIEMIDLADLVPVIQRLRQRLEVKK